MSGISRRDMVGGLLAAQAIPSPAAETGREIVRDHFWIFTVNAGNNDDYLGQAGIRGGSRMTPAEGAFYLGVPNLILVRENNLPPTPRQQGWRSRTSFDQYAISFTPLKRVVWSVVGSSGQMEGDEVPLVLDLAKRYPNIAGVYLDDFFMNDGRAALSIEKLKRNRERLIVNGRPLPSWLTLYTRFLNPQFAKLDPPLESYLELFDVVTLWTSNSNDLTELEKNLDLLEKAAPRASKALGCYLFDFRNHKPVPIPLMEKQCTAGLRLLKEGRITEMIFLANTVLDVGFEVAEWTRQWIRHAGDGRLG